MNRLIRRCLTDATVQRGAARSIEPGRRLDDLLFFSHRRDEFVSELEAEIIALGGHPRKSLSPLTDFWSALREMREAVVGFNASDALATCAKVEKKTHELYEHALLADLPARPHAIVERQRAEIEHDVAVLRKDSFLP